VERPPLQPEWPDSDPGGIARAPPAGTSGGLLEVLLGHAFAERSEDALENLRTTVPEQQQKRGEVRGVRWAHKRNKKLAEGLVGLTRLPTMNTSLA